MIFVEAGTKVFEGASNKWTGRCEEEVLKKRRRRRSGGGG